MNRSLLKSIFSFASKNDNLISKNLTHSFHSNKLVSYAPMVPIVIEQSGRGERAYDIYSRLLKERIICFMGPVIENSVIYNIKKIIFFTSSNKNAGHR